MTAEQENPIETLKSRLAGIDPIPVRMIIDGEQIDAGPDPKATIAMSAETLGKMISGETDSATEFLSGALKIEGDMMVAAMFGQALDPEAADAGTSAPVEAGPEPTGENAKIAFFENIGLITGDLEDTRKRIEKLGFITSKRGRHRVEVRPGEFAQWGTGNHCMHFKNNSFLELIGHVDTNYPAGLYGDQLSKYGNHWGKITLHVTSNDDETARIRAAGGYVTDPGFFFRYHEDKPFSPTPGNVKKSSLISYPPSLEDGFMVIGMQHFEDFPPDLETLEHPNGVERIAFAILVAQDPDAQSERYARHLAHRREKTDMGWRIRFAGPSDLLFVGFDDLPEQITKPLAGRPIAIAAVGYRVSDIAKTRAYLEGAGVAAEDHRFGLMVAEPVEGTGATFFTDKD